MMHRLASLTPRIVVATLGAGLLVACSGDDTANPADAAAPDATTPDASPVADAAPAADAGAASDGAVTSDGAAASDGSTETDPVTSSFVTIGCNRIAAGDWDGGTDPSSANVAQLQQDFTDIAAIADAPPYLFFTGDLVLGLTTKLPTLSGQLAAWTELYSSAPLASKLQLVPLPGNHEILYKASLDDGGTAETQNNYPDGGSDEEWLAWLAASKFDSKAGNGPDGAAPNADGLADDQSKLSYSFNDHGNHYVVLNTDTWAQADAGAPIGLVPLAWLTADLAAAQADATVTSIFVFGHKPIVSPDGATDSADVINPALTQPLETLLDGTAKVKGYFCAHYHAWDARALPGPRGVMQVIAGNGGSTLETTWKPPVTYYGFTEVRVHQSGKVGVVSYQRPVPTPYNATTGVVAAQPQPETIIAQ